jgi:hypothetical protein
MATEMKFMRTAGYTRSDYKANLYKMKEQNMQPVKGFINRYRPNCQNHVLRVSVKTVPAQILRHQQKGPRSLGTSYKR